MNNTEQYLTAEKKQALEQELQELKTTKRKEILESLEFAKSLGDLSENAEYQQAREEQAALEERIAEIENILKTAIIIKQHHSEKVEMGSAIIVRKEGDKEEKSYQIVGTHEVDMAAGKISNTSPIGQALFGKKKGDTISFKTPGGIVNYKIIDIK
ncbi:MAG TPA: transcription elongation factor GreA [Candidatus Paceibacterota bacterium]|nr:transcription elongation factor GreA [Candidatus Paceibacterota bacterium]